MKAYEAGQASYFATPPVNLIYAFHASLSLITKSSISLEDRFRLHREASQKVKDAAAKLGLKQVPVEPEYVANGMTAVRSCSFMAVVTVLIRSGFWLALLPRWPGRRRHYSADGWT